MPTHTHIVGNDSGRNYFQCFFKIGRMTRAYYSDKLDVTVSDLKQHIEDYHGIPKINQRIRYSCRTLNNENVLLDHVVHDTTVEILPPH